MKRAFGPFVDVDAAEIVRTNFKCRACQRPVEKLARQLPAMVPRMMFYACRCGTLVVWEDEHNPRGAHDWKSIVKLLKRSGAGVVIFNGGKELKADFAGRN